MTLDSLLLLFVAAPLLTSALTVLVRRPLSDRTLMIGVPALSSAGGVALLVVHASEPVLAHSVGSFAPGVAIPFVSDTLTAVMLTVTGFTTAICGWFLVTTGEDRYRFVPSLTLMLTAGVNGALLTGDLFNLFVFVEVMLLPSYALLAVTGTWRRLGVSRMFVLVNLVTSTVLLIGVALVYGAAGTVNLAALADRGALDPRVGLALCVVLVALLVKAGVVPVHGWLPRAYPATSAGIMGLFSGLHTKVALYAVYRIYAVTFGGDAPWIGVLVGVVIVTMLLGAVGTFAEQRMRGALAYQMVSGVGHILIGLTLFTPWALAAGVFYLVHHIVTMGGLVLTAGAIENTYGTGRLDRLSGLMRRDPWVATVAGLGLFSLIGLPPTSGLWGKVGLMVSAAMAGGVEAWLFITTIVLASVLSLLALQRVWRDIFWGPPLEAYRPDDADQGRGTPTAPSDDVRVRAGSIAPASVLIGTSVTMFALVGFLFPIATRAANDLVDIGPYVAAVLP